MGLLIAASLFMLAFQPKEKVFRNSELSLRVKPVYGEGNKAIELTFHNFSSHDIVICTFIYQMVAFGKQGGKDVLLTIDPRLLDQKRMDSGDFLILPKASETIYTLNLETPFTGMSEVQVDVGPYKGDEMHKYLADLQKTTGAKQLTTSISASVEIR